MVVHTTTTIPSPAHCEGVPLTRDSFLLSRYGAVLALPYSIVKLLARLRGLLTSAPRAIAA